MFSFSVSAFKAAGKRSLPLRALLSSSPPTTTALNLWQCPSSWCYRELSIIPLSIQWKQGSFMRSAP